MANKKPETKAEGTAAEAVKAPQDTPKPKFTVTQLAKNCVEQFNVSSSTFVGAFYGHEDETFTVDEARAIIDKFLYGGED